MKEDVGGVHLYDRLNTPYKWMQYSIDGKVYRESTHTADEAEAEKIRKRKRDQIGKAREDMVLLPTAKERKVKVSALLDSAEVHLKVNAKAKGKGEFLSPQDKSHIKPIRDYFGDKGAASLTEADILNYIDKRQNEGKSSATINNELTMLRLALSLAKKKVGPGPEIKKLKVENARNVLLEKPEIEALLPHSPEDLRDYVEFAFITGMRKTEISSLGWRDYNASTGILTLPA